MKTFKFAFLFFAILSIAACTDDDDGTTVCAQTDWAGTYTGTVECDGTVEDITVTVVASGAANILVSYQTATLQTEFDALPFDGCNLTATATGGGQSIALNASLTGGDLTVMEVISDSTSVVSTCAIVATRN